MATSNKIRTFFLGEAAKTHEERKLVQKLDFFIMTYSCLSYFFNFLDRAAFANAYVAGMREALQMNGKDYSNVLAVTTAGMVTGMIPHGIIVQKVRPSIWFPLMVVIWGALTIVTSAVKTVPQLCVIRFFLGICEASTFSGAMYVIGAWYKPAEISKRTALFSASGQIGTMFAGVMMTAVYKGMNGMAKLAGWQWVFIIDGIITMPIAVFGFFYFPDIPENTRASYLSEEERALAIARAPPLKKDAHSISPLSLAKRVLWTPVFWVLFFWSPVCAAIEAFPFQNNFLLWLKYNKASFTQTQINTYPLGVQATGIVATFLCAWHMDVTGQRAPMAILAALIQIIVGAMLVVPTLPKSGTFFAFYLSGTAYMVNPTIFGWANIILQRNGDDAVRSVTLYCMNIGSMVLWTFWGILFYNGADAPYWKNGSIVLIVCSCVMMVYVFAVKKIDNYTLEKAYKDPSGEHGDSVSEDGQEKQAGAHVTEEPVAVDDKKL